MIPLLRTIYQEATKKDHDILTIFMLLMHDNKYPPFMGSVSNRKLYGPTDPSAPSADPYYGSFLDFNTANEALIIQRATDFYNGLHQ